MLVYLLKANIILALLYAFYRLLFKGDTFFGWRRAVLLCIVAISLVAPLPALQQRVQGLLPQAATGIPYADVLLPEFVITPDGTDAAGHAYWQPDVLAAIYAAGVLLLAGRMCIQLLAIARMAHRCRPMQVGGTRIRRLPDGMPPFSFFRWIFLCPTAHTPEELEEICTHEETHVRQWHSIDVMAGELVCILCWFNPFVWLLKREIRDNLEYLADRRVLARGHDPKTYQYHLLGLAYHKAAANIYNNFNVLPLKKRIKMMNKQKTKAIGRLKYLFFLPVAALLAAACSGNQKQEQPAQEPAQEQVAPPAEASTDEVRGTVEGPIFEVVEKAPEFPGGVQALMKFLQDNVKYPQNARDANIEGRVICQYVVTTDGSIADIKVIRGVDPSLDEEAVRVIKSMPKWKPGMQNGQPVNVRYTIPISFKLQ